MRFLWPPDDAVRFLDEHRAVLETSRRPCRGAGMTMFGLFLAAYRADKQRNASCPARYCTTVRDVSDSRDGGDVVTYIRRRYSTYRG